MSTGGQIKGVSISRQSNPVMLLQAVVCCFKCVTQVENIIVAV